MLKIKDIFKIDLHYDVVCVDYDSGTHPCSCSPDDYCRCGTIEGVRITSVDLERFAARILNKDATIFDLYCVERILTAHRVYNPESYDTSIQSGYYGQELGDTNLIYNSDLDKDLQNFSLLTTSTEKIEFILNVEYKNLLPEVQNLDWEIATIPRIQLNCGADGHMIKIDRDALKHYQDRELPRGIAIEISKDRYRLIDGYHRMKAFSGDEVTLVIGKPKG